MNVAGMPKLARSVVSLLAAPILSGSSGTTETQPTPSAVGPNIRAAFFSSASRTVPDLVERKPGSCSRWCGSALDRLREGYSPGRQANCPTFGRRSWILASGTPARFRIRCQTLDASAKCPVAPLPGKTYSESRGSAFKISTAAFGSGSGWGRPALVDGIRQVFCSKSMSLQRADNSSLRRVPSNRPSGKYARQCRLDSSTRAALTRRNSSGERKRSRFSSW